MYLKKTHSLTLSLSLSLSLAIAASLFATNNIQAETWEQSYDFEYSNAEAQALDVKLRDADLEVIGDSSTQSINVSVYHKVKGGSEERAEAYFEREKVECRVDGSTLIVENPNRLQKHTRFSGFTHHHTRVTITCPVEMQTTLTTSDGDLSVKNLKGNTDLRTSDGDISVDGIEGVLELATSDGDVRIQHAMGKISARSSDGDIKIENLTGSIQAKTSDGDISIHMDSDPTEACVLNTSDGDVYFTVKNPASLRIKVKVSDGSIQNHIEGSRTIMQKRNKQEIEIGSGENQISIYTSDGSVVLDS